MVRLVAVAVVLATGLDVALSALEGYAVRAEGIRTVAVISTLLLPLVVGILLLHEAARRLTGFALARTPVSSALLAGALPVLGLRVVRAASARELAVALGLGLVVAVLVRVRRADGRAPFAPTALAVTGLALLLVAIWSPLPGRSMLRPPAPGRGGPADASRPNLLVIMLDTMRADHLGAYGYPRRTSPWLDGFAAQAVLYEHAISTSSWTLPSHATLFTGLFPRAHGADVIEDGAGMSLAQLGRLEDTASVRPLSPAATTLAELAAQAGMETGAICANSAYLYRVFGLDQGFDTYVDAAGSRPDHRPVGLALGLRLKLERFWPFQRLIDANERYYLLGPEVNTLALRWLEERRERRFFLFLNYMDTHEPRVPPLRYLPEFPAAERPVPVDTAAIRSRARPILPAEQQGLIDVYDASVRYLDGQLAHLFAELAARGHLEHTVVLFVGDHGESLGEHQELGHANGVYASEVHVPLMLRLPGAPARRVPEVVHLADVLPTLVDVLHLEHPPVVQGTSLLGTERSVPAVAFAAAYPDLVRAFPRFYDRSQYAVYRDPWVLISGSDGTRQLYDFRRDPAQANDLAATRPDEVAALSAELAKFEQTVQPRFPVESGAMDDETRRRLQALGYLN